MDTPNTTDNLKERTAKGLFWSIMGNGAQQLVVMLIGILLARLLDRADYGLVGMLTVFSILASNLQESGFTAALSVKKEATHEDFNAVFWFSTIVSAALYVILFFCAPLIAHYNRAPELTLLGRVIFLGFFFTSLGISHVAWLLRNLKVREKTMSQVTASLVSGFIGLGCAFCGCGVWSLVAMDLSYKLTHTLMAWYWTPWHPTFPSLRAGGLREALLPAWRMFGFGSRLLITNSLNTINGQLLQSLLGHYYKPNQVGDYSQANKWNTLGTSLLGGMINSVARPVMAKVEDDGQRQKRVVRKMLRFTAMLSFPAMMGLGLIAPEFIVLTVGEKWIFCVPYLQVLCVGGAVFPVNEIFTNLMISRQRSDLYLYSTAAFLVVQLALVWAFTGEGYADMMPLLISVVSLQPMWFFVLYAIARRLLDVRLFEVLADVVPFILAALFSLTLGHFAAEGVAGFVVADTTVGRIVLMLTKVLVTASAYCLIMWTARVAVFRECLDFALAKFRK
ncbi:MAG: lipopolysaccharide biosynthesis protein [Bacteroidales bacterium]|nr:lipopolysaccharide biosynthesis protein [Bacteroidales bacterium]